MPNVELLQKTLAYIKENPERWDQSQWHCGSTACFAGHACLLSGYKMTSATTVRRGVHFPRPIALAAMELLGITTWEAKNLFAASNSLSRLELMVNNLIHERDIYYHPARGVSLAQAEASLQQVTDGTSGEPEEPEAPPVPEAEKELVTV